MNNLISGRAIINTCCCKVAPARQCDDGDGVVWIVARWCWPLAMSCSLWIPCPCSGWCHRRCPGSGRLNSCAECGPCPWTAPNGGYLVMAWLPPAGWAVDWHGHVLWSRTTAPCRGDHCFWIFPECIVFCGPANLRINVRIGAYFLSFFF